MHVTPPCFSQMLRKRIKQLVEGKQPEDVIDMALTLPLGIGAIGYSAGYAFRRGLYAAGIKRRVKPAVPTISIGNLTLGGTGKTPFAIYLAEQMQERGRNCVILSRGYGRRTKTPEPLIVSNGNKMLASPDSAGDEPFLMAASLPGTPVIVGRERRLSAVTAIREFSPDLLILDDGFQHWPLERDVNLVLWDASLLPSNASLTPLGPLREPLSALRRADAIIFTRPQEWEHLDRAKTQIENIAPNLPQYIIHFEPDSIVSLDGKSALTKEEIKEKKFFAFCALARPEKFPPSIEQTGTHVTGTAFFTDHHYYTARDMKRLCKNAASTGADALITTAKDAVKLRKIAAESTLPIFVLSISPRFDPLDDEQQFIEWLEEKLF